MNEAESTYESRSECLFEMSVVEESGDGQHIRSIVHQNEEEHSRQVQLGQVEIVLK